MNTLRSIKGVWLTGCQLFALSVLWPYVNALHQWITDTSLARAFVRSVFALG